MADSNSAETLPDRAKVCNDPSGLLLAGDSSLSQNTGVYTNLVRLASQLSSAAPTTPTKTSTSTSAEVSSNHHPLITLETTDAAILVKEYYGGHAVAFRVPSQSGTTEDASSPQEK